MRSCVEESMCLKEQRETVEGVWFLMWEFTFVYAEKKNNCGRHDHESQHATMSKDRVGEENVEDGMLLGHVTLWISAEQHVRNSSKTEFWVLHLCNCAHFSFMTSILTYVCIVRPWCHTQLFQRNTATCTYRFLWYVHLLFSSFCSFGKY
jgi:hypothetical protein